MRKLGAALSAAVLLALVPATSNAGTADCETVMVRAWNVKPHVQQKVYRIGDKVRIRLTVTRKKTGTPVAGAATAVAVTDEPDGFVFDSGTTDDKGRVTVNVPLKAGHISAGIATLHAYAYETTVDVYCAALLQYGFKKVPGAFRIEN